MIRKIRYSFLLISAFLMLSCLGCAQQNDKQTSTQKKTEMEQSEIQKTEHDQPVEAEKTSKHNKINEADKEEIKKLTLIELGSVRCIPCRKMQPLLDEIEKQYSEQVNVVFHDVWTAEGRQYAEKYRIRLIPTQVFLDKSGREYFRHEGFYPLDEIIDKLKEGGLEK